MIYILLSILSSTSIFILFRGIDKYKTFTHQIIVINYLVASILGLSISSGWQQIFSTYERNWFFLSIPMGILFIVMFFMIGISSLKAGISITTVACKMSVIIPILFSILYYKEIISWQKISGIVLALVALVFSVWKKPEKKEGIFLIFLPLILFLGLGTIDTLVKYAQQSYILPAEASFFTAFVFGISFFAGVIVGVFRKDFFKGFTRLHVLVFGVLLGLSNFGSFYFMICALNKSGWDSSVVFGVNNMGIVALSVLAGLIWYKEKLKIINWIGISFAFIAIWFLTGLYGF
jgi:drug/metabolite transporter (DMT)-like permease